MRIKKLAFPSHSLTKFFKNVSELRRIVNIAGLSARTTGVTVVGGAGADVITAGSGADIAGRIVRPSRLKED